MSVHQICYVCFKVVSVMSHFNLAPNIISEAARDAICKGHCMKAQIDHFCDKVVGNLTHVQGAVQGFVGQITMVEKFLGILDPENHLDAAHEEKNDEFGEKKEDGNDDHSMEDDDGKELKDHNHNLSPSPVGQLRAYRARSFNDGYHKRVNTAVRIDTRIKAWFRQNQLLCSANICPKERIRLILSQQIRMVWPHLEIALFTIGSTLNDLMRPVCDLDICLVIYKDGHVDENLRDRKKALAKLEQLKVLLNKSIVGRKGGSIRDLEVIPAKTPIIKFRYIYKCDDIEVNININRLTTLRNTLLLKLYGQLDGRFKPFVTAVKKWAKDKGINDAYGGTLSSYSLVLMATHFLQVETPCVIPCIPPAIIERQMTISETWNTIIDDTLLSSFVSTKLPKFVSKNRLSAGELFLGFLKYYWHFNFNQHAISVRTGKLIDIDNYGGKFHHQPQPYIYIEEPFDLKNTAHSVREKHIFDEIVKSFKTSYVCLRKGQGLKDFLK